MRLDSLTTLLDKLALQTWWKLERAHALGMNMGEVSITDHNLLDVSGLIRDSNLSITLKATTSDESTTGADFEIWLDHQGRYFLGYSIQAKVVTVSGPHFKYPMLSHSVGPKGAKVPQYDILIAHAAKYQTHPIHLFYNGWNLPDPAAPTTPGAGDPHLFGCAAVSTHAVAATRKRTQSHKGQRHSIDVNDYLVDAIPWSDLFRPQNTPGRTSNGSPSRGGSQSQQAGGPSSVGGSKSQLVSSSSRPSKGADTDSSNAEEDQGVVDSRSAIVFDGRGIRALETRMAGMAHGAVEVPRATSLPDYVKQAQSPDMTFNDLPKDPTLPRAVLLITTT